MTKTSVVDVEMDAFDQACLALKIPDEDCAILREAAEEVYLKGREKAKRSARSEYQQFISQCMKEEIKRLGSAPEAMKHCAQIYKEEKQKKR
jgi:TRAP-type C4-dicarboxylate transport system substrate-binding protein